VGAKWILSHHNRMPALVSLSVIVAMLLIGVIASVFVKPKDAT